MLFIFDILYFNIVGNSDCQEGGPLIFFLYFPVQFFLY
jgi:hypothetical protein